MDKILLVTGSRTINDYKFVSKCLDEIREIFPFDFLMHGGAVGVDTFVGMYAMMRGIGCIVKSADWKRYGKAAGPIRNKQMVKKCTKGIGIWDGTSKGTGHCIDELKKANKLLKVFKYEMQKL